MNEIEKQLREMVSVLPATMPQTGMLENLLDDAANEILNLERKLALAQRFFCQAVSYDFVQNLHQGREAEVAWNKLKRDRMV